MKRLKKCLSAFLAVLLVFLTFTNTVQAEEIKENKKIISIVYDDSGSMFDSVGSWASANYAMQAFAALLNEQDEMYITYMSDITDGNNKAVKIDLTKVKNSVKNIREDVDMAGGTPLDAVDVAMDKLVSIKETDPNTQFWLVVLTDGAMSTYVKSKHSTIEETLKDYAGTKMSNGTSLYVNYVGLGNNATDIKGNAGKGLTSFQAKSDIVPVLSEIANKISGRLKFEKSEMKQIDGKTIQVHSEIPLYSISVFSQGTNAKVAAAKSEADLTVDRNIALKYPEYSGETTNKNLFGNAAVINNGTSIISSGDYTITFSEEVNLKNTVIMYQPAIQMKAVITKNGVEVNDPAELAIDDEVDIEIVPTNPETGDEIKESSLPSGINWKVSYSVDNTVKAEKDGKLLSDVTVESGTNSITASMQIPEYAPMTQVITFTPAVAVEYGIIANNPEQSDFKRNKLGIKNVEGDVTTFQITGDGTPLTKKELKKLRLEVKDVKIDDSWVEGALFKIGIKKATVKLELNDDGTFSLYPTGIGVPAFLIKAGTYQVTVALDTDKSITAEGCFNVIPSWEDFIDVIPLIIGLLLLAYLIYIIFVKYKFNGQTLRIEVYKPEGALGGGRHIKNMDESAVLKKFGGDILLPARSCHKRVGGLKFHAGPYGEACLSINEIRGYEKYGFSSQKPEVSYESIVTSLKEVKSGKDGGKKNREEKKATGNDMIIGTRPLFLKQGNRLYKITAK